MRHPQTRDLSEARLVSRSETEMVELYRREGKKVIQCRGRYWQNTHHGFYQGIHWLSRMSAEQATRPASLSWGYRVCLVEEDAHAANGSMPVHLLTELEGYDIQSIPSKRRNQLRKCGKHVEIVELTGPALLEDNGYSVMKSSSERLRLGHTMSREQFQRHVNAILKPDEQVTLGGIIEGKLGGYLYGYVIEGTAYISTIHIATNALWSCIGTGLAFEFVRVCERCKNVKEIVYGLHFPEDKGLAYFKEGMRFNVVQVPTRVSINPILRRLIKWRSPGVYYRLTGIPVDVHLKEGQPAQSNS